MDISSYLGPGKIKSLRGEVLLSWCKDQEVNALALKAGEHDSFELRLELLRISVRHQKSLKSVLPFILAPFSSSPQRSISPSLLPQVLPVALCISSKEHREEVFTFFALWNLETDFVESTYRILIQECRFAQAFACVLSFGHLCDPAWEASFLVVLPLIVKNQMDLITMEGKVNAPFQKMLVEDLDSTYYPAVRARYPFINVEMPPRNVSKTLLKLFKIFGLHEDRYSSIAPNFFLEKLILAMKYHANIKTSLRLNDWRDILAWNIEKYPYLEVYARRLFHQKFAGDPEEVNHWNTRLGWSLPFRPSSGFKSTGSVPKSPPNAFLQLDIPRSKILFINSKNFESFIQALSGPVVTGYDSEFMSDFGIYRNKVVLAQIAIHKKVYLLDMMELVEHPKLLERFRDAYFNNPQIKILGYAIHSDFQALATTHDVFSGMDSSSEVKAHIIDLEGAANFLRSTKALKANPTKEKGLSGLMESLFGKPMDKSFQRSFWMRRPLEEEQVMYGALDAYILIQAYEKLKSLVDAKSKDHPSYEAFFGDKSQGGSSKKKKSKAQKKKELKASGEASPPEPAQSVPPIIPSKGSHKFICNSMLQGLTKKLRAYGIDTLFIETSDSQLIADAALSGDRIILTRGKMVEQLRKNRPDVSVYSVTNDKAEEQVKDVILNLGLDVKEEDIFVRCVLCNCNEYVILSPENMSFLFDALGNKKKGHLLVGSHQIAYPSMQLPSGVVLKIRDVPPEKASAVDSFYVCSSCGHVFWKGSHWDALKLKRNALKKTM